MNTWRGEIIGDVFHTITGSTPAKSNEQFYGDFIPLVKPPELSDSIVIDASDGLSELGASEARVVPAGTILVSCIGNLGKVGLAGRSLAVNQQINCILPRPERALPQFMFYQALSPAFRHQLEALATGTTIQIVNKSKFNGISVFLPSLTEQARIVAILDDAFAGIAKAKVNAARNVENARGLFSAILRNAFADRVDWEEFELGSRVRFIDYRGKTPPKVDAGVRLITAKNVKMGFIQTTPEEFIPEAAYSAWMTRGIPKRGDVLFTTEAPLGNVAQLDTDEQVVVGQRLITMQADLKNLAPEFLKYLLMSPDVQAQIHRLATGATVQGIKARLLKQVKVASPTLIAQRRIAEHLDTAYSAAKALESRYKAKVRACEELRTSLLATAFTGQLTNASAVAA